MSPSELSSQAKTHLANIRVHYEKGSGLTNAALAYRDILAAYYNLLIPASASVLEVGCGAGDLLSRLQVSRRCGVDVSPRQIGLAKEKVPDGRFYVQAGEALDLPAESFDYIIVSETINQAADVQSLFISCDRSPMRIRGLSSTYTTRCGASNLVGHRTWSS